MPLFTPGTIQSKGAPEISVASLRTKEWCELEYYDLVDLPSGSATYEYDRMGEREKLFVCDGSCDVSIPDGDETTERGDVLEIDGPDSTFTVTAVHDDVRLIRVAGTWGDEIGGYGIFQLGRGDPPEKETPVSYPKETAFDNHYHDCDEYWIGISGRATAVSEDRFYEIGPGDCLATGMGYHHDMPIVHQEPFCGVFFETTLRGEKRRGHLWEPTDGPAEPSEERV